MPSRVAKRGPLYDLEGVSDAWPVKTDGARDRSPVEDPLVPQSFTNHLILWRVFFIVYGSR
jgi:hypothetical protein